MNILVASGWDRKGHPKTLDISYNIKPHQSPKETKHQFHRGECLKSKIIGWFA
jgi:hypothetical protein